MNGAEPVHGDPPIECVSDLEPALPHLSWSRGRTFLLAAWLFGALRTCMCLRLEFGADSSRRAQSRAAS